ncbi:uncharacterized protein LOC132941878 [Metopolophium dirhodum]|uniref:uncharacterized protein LOC132941878 n=1 Tax=Metopolophium dirhodum TaxID=44670 RepID=UPI00298F82E1|nr:uncharacterized protein LOC132941878 [Metopolophium dirhodum]
MCTVCYLWFIACSLLMTNASILNDLQEAQKFMEQLDYDYSAVVADAAAAAAQQRPVADLLWYDYGGGSGVSGGVGGGSSGAGYYGGGSPVTGVQATAALFGADKRGGTTQSSNGGIWFGPRLGRRKRRGGSPFSGNVVHPVDGNAIAPAASSLLQQNPLASGSTSAAAEQAAVSDLINNVPWVLVPIIDNSLYTQIQMKQNARNGRSSEEDDDDVASRSRHSARSPPYSPPFSPRLGRQAIMAQPQVPRLGRETLLYRRDARNALYQQSNATLLKQQRQQQQQQQQQQHPLQAAAESAAAQRQAV